MADTEDNDAAATAASAEAEAAAAATAAAEAKAAEEAEAAQDAEKWKALSRKNEAAAKKAMAELAKLKTDGQSEAEKAIAKAKDEGKAEATTSANARIVKAEVRAIAAGKIDPNLAIKLLDLDQFEVGDDGEVDEKAITKAIGDLLKQHPALAANGIGKGSADGGARGGASGQPDMNAWLRGERVAL